MRGVLGFVPDVILPVLFATCFGLSILFAARKARLERHRHDERRQARIQRRVLQTPSVLSILLVMPLGITYLNSRIHYDLWMLQPQDVREIQVGGRNFTDATSIKRIVSDLKSSEWYSVNHGGWGDETPIIIRFASGSQWQMRAGYHFAQHGAVVLRSSGPNGRGWGLGEVFSVSLPQTLEELGAPLSLCDIAHGHPCEIQSKKAAP